MHEASVGEWEDSPEYTEHVLKRIAESCNCELNGKESCDCTWRGTPALKPLLHGVNCDAYDGMDDIAHLINYGSQPGDWRPSGGYDSDDENLDPEYLYLPGLTAFCTICGMINRFGERGLSHVEKKPNGKLMRVCDKPCRSCRDEYDQI